MKKLMIMLGVLMALVCGTASAGLQTELSAIAFNSAAEGEESDGGMSWYADDGDC